MASAWGASWGSAWGASWGSRAVGGGNTGRWRQLRRGVGDQQAIRNDIARRSEQEFAQNLASAEQLARDIAAKKEGVALRIQEMSQARRDAEIKALMQKAIRSESEDIAIILLLIAAVI